MAIRFQNKYLVDIYRYALLGIKEKQIAKKIGITQAGFIGWKKRRPSVRYALKLAAQEKEKAEKLNWSEYVRGRLPERLQAIWKEITEYSKTTSGYRKTQLLLKRKSKRVRQELLVYSILVSGFNLSKALRTCAIERSVFTYWIETEPEFVELLNEVQNIKKDFIEDSLLRLIKSGDSPSTIFASRTLNKDRGYGERIEHLNTHQHSLTVSPILISELDLPSETIRILLDAIKTKENQNTLPVQNALPIVDAELVKTVSKTRKTKT